MSERAKDPATTKATPAADRDIPRGTDEHSDAPHKRSGERSATSLPRTGASEEEERDDSTAR